MRVGLNATCFNDRPSGAKQRFCGIYGELIRRRPDVEFIVYEPADCQVATWFGGAPNVSVRRTPFPSTGRLRRSVGGLTYWKPRLRRDRLDLFETFNLPLVRAPDCPTILTVHDARPVLIEVPLLKRLLYGHILKSALRNADHVVTVSETMKREIAAIEPKADVTVIYNGINPATFREARDVGEVRDRLNLSHPFILAVGHLETRKNYSRLIDAIAQLGQIAQPISLVIVGNDGGDGPAIARRIKDAGVEDRVTLLQGVTDPELAALYALCTLVVFPSYYEGFGIPVLEAMAAGRPLILSDIPVFRELTEGSAHYFPAHDSGEMAAAIAAILSDESRKKALVSYGAERVKAFTYPKLAAQLDALYRRFSKPSEHI